MQVTSAMEDQDGEMVVKRLSVPVGLEELMTGLTKEVLKKKPRDVYTFASEHFAQLLALRDNGNYQKAPTKTGPYMNMKNGDIRNMNGNLPITKPLSGGSTKQLSRQVSIRAISPVRKLGLKKKRSGTPKFDDNNNEDKMKLKQEKRPTAGRCPTPGNSSKFDNLEPVKEDSLKMMAKKQNASKKHQDVKGRTNSNTRESKKSSSDEGEKPKKKTSSPSKKLSTKSKEIKEKDKNKSEENKSEESVKFIPRNSSAEESTVGIKDNRLTVTPPKIIKAAQTPTEGLDLPTTLVVPVVAAASTCLSAAVDNNESEKTGGEPSDNFRKDLKNDSETGEILSVAKESLEGASGKYDPSLLRDELQKAEEDAKLNNFTTSYNPYKLRQEIKNASKDKEEDEQQQTTVPDDNKTDLIQGQSKTSASVTGEEASSPQTGLSAGLQHSGELHDTVILKEGSKDDNNRRMETPKEEKDLDADELRKISRITLQHSGELHDTVIPTETDSKTEKVNTEEISSVFASTAVAATKIQAFWRGFSVRKNRKGKLNKLLDQHKEQIPSKMQNTIAGGVLQRDTSIQSDEKTEAKDEKLLATGKLPDEGKSSEHHDDLSVFPVSCITDNRNEETEGNEKLSDGIVRVTSEKQHENIIPSKVIKNKSLGEIGTEKLSLPVFSKSLSVTDSAISKTLDEDDEKLRSLTEDVESLGEQTEDLGIESEMSSILQMDSNKITNSASDVMNDKQEEAKAVRKESDLEYAGEEVQSQNNNNSNDNNKSQTNVTNTTGDQEEERNVKGETIIKDQLPLPELSKDNVDNEKETLGLTKSSQSDSKDGLQHSGELHDILISKDKEQTADELDLPLLASEQSKMLLTSNGKEKDEQIEKIIVAPLQHSSELHDTVAEESKEKVETLLSVKESKTAEHEQTDKTSDSLALTETDKINKDLKNKTLTTTTLQHSSELHDPALPEETKEKIETLLSVEESKKAELEPTDKINDSHNLTEANKSDKDLEGKTLTATELQHSGELHDLLIPKIDHGVELIKQQDNTETTKDMEKGAEPSSLLPEKEIDQNEVTLKSTTHQDINKVYDNSKPKDVEEVLQQERKVPTVDSQQIEEDIPDVMKFDDSTVSGIQHSSELHDVVLPNEPIKEIQGETKPENIESQQIEKFNNALALAQESKDTKSDVDLPTGDLQHSSEFHDTLIPKGIEKGPDVLTLEQTVKDNEKFGTTTITNLQHSSEIHDLVIPKETDKTLKEAEEALQEEKILAAVNSKQTGERDTETVLKVQDSKIGDLYHTSELHDSLIPKEAQGTVQEEKQLTDNSQQIEKLSDVLSKQQVENGHTVEDVVKNDLQRSSELHDLLIPKAISENTLVQNDSLHKNEQSKIAEVKNTDNDNQHLVNEVFPEVTLQQSGELHDLLIQKESPEGQVSSESKTPIEFEIKDHNVVIQNEGEENEKESTTVSDKLSEEKDNKLHDAVVPKDKQLQEDKTTLDEKIEKEADKMVQAQQENDSFEQTNLHEEDKIVKSKINAEHDTLISKEGTDDQIKEKYVPILALQHSGEMHDNLIPQETDAVNQQLQDDKEQANEINLQHSGELHDILIPKESDIDSEEIKGNSTAYPQLSKKATQETKESKADHIVERVTPHEEETKDDSVIGESKKDSEKKDNNDNLEAEKIDPHTQVSDAKSVDTENIIVEIPHKENNMSATKDNDGHKQKLEKQKNLIAATLQHSGEMHDILMSEENKASTTDLQSENISNATDKQKSSNETDGENDVNGSDEKQFQKTEINTEGPLQDQHSEDKSSEGLQHSGEFHDILIPHESQLETGSPTNEVTQVDATINKQNPVEENSGAQIAATTEVPPEINSAKDVKVTSDPNGKQEEHSRDDTQSHDEENVGVQIVTTTEVPPKINSANGVKVTSDSNGKQEEHSRDDTQSYDGVTQEPQISDDNKVQNVDVEKDNSIASDNALLYQPVSTSVLEKLPESAKELSGMEVSKTAAIENLTLESNLNDLHEIEAAKSEKGNEFSENKSSLSHLDEIQSVAITQNHISEAAPIAALNEPLEHFLGVEQIGQNHNNNDIQIVEQNVNTNNNNNNENGMVDKKVAQNELEAIQNYEHSKNKTEKSTDEKEENELSKDNNSSIDSLHNNNNSDDNDVDNDKNKKGRTEELKNKDNKSEEKSQSSMNGMALIKLRKQNADMPKESTEGLEESNTEITDPISERNGDGTKDTNKIDTISISEFNHENDNISVEPNERVKVKEEISIANNDALATENNVLKKQESGIVDEKVDKQLVQTLHAKKQDEQQQSDNKKVPEDKTVNENEGQLLHNEGNNDPFIESLSDSPNQKDNKQSPGKSVTPSELKHIEEQIVTDEKLVSSDDSHGSDPTKDQLRKQNSSPVQIGKSDAETKEELKLNKTNDILVEDGINNKESDAKNLGLNNGIQVQELESKDVLENAKEIKEENKGTDMDKESEKLHLNETKQAEEITDKTASENISDSKEKPNEEPKQNNIIVKSVEDIITHKESDTKKLHLDDDEEIEKQKDQAERKNVDTSNSNKEEDKNKLNDNIIEDTVNDKESDAENLDESKEIEKMTDKITSENISDSKVKTNEESKQNNKITEKSVKDDINNKKFDAKYPNLDKDKEPKKDKDQAEANNVDKPKTNKEEYNSNKTNGDVIKDTVNHNESNTAHLHLDENGQMEEQRDNIAPENITKFTVETKEETKLNKIVDNPLEDGVSRREIDNKNLPIYEDKELGEDKHKSASENMDVLKTDIKEEAKQNETNDDKINRKETDNKIPHLDEMEHVEKEKNKTPSDNMNKFETEANEKPNQNQAKDSSAEEDISGKEPDTKVLFTNDEKQIEKEKGKLTLKKKFDKNTDLDGTENDLAKDNKFSAKEATISETVANNLETSDQTTTGINKLKPDDKIKLDVKANEGKETKITEEAAENKSKLTDEIDTKDKLQECDVSKLQNTEGYTEQNQDQGGSEEKSKGTLEKLVETEDKTTSSHKEQINEISADEEDKELSNVNVVDASVTESSYEDQKINIFPDKITKEENALLSDESLALPTEIKKAPDIINRDNVSELLKDEYKDKKQLSDEKHQNDKKLEGVDKSKEESDRTDIVSKLHAELEPAEKQASDIKDKNSSETLLEISNEDSASIKDENTKENIEKGHTDESQESLTSEKSNNTSVSDMLSDNNNKSEETSVAQKDVEVKDKLKNIEKQNREDAQELDKAVTEAKVNSTEEKETDRHTENGLNTNQHDNTALLEVKKDKEEDLNEDFAVEAANNGDTIKSESTVGGFDISKLHSEVEQVGNQAEQDQEQNRGINKDILKIPTKEDTQEADTITDKVPGHTTKQFTTENEAEFPANKNDENVLVADASTNVIDKDEANKKSEECLVDDKTPSTSFDISKLRAELKDTEDQTEKDKEEKILNKVVNKDLETKVSDNISIEKLMAAGNEELNTKEKSTTDTVDDNNKNFKEEPIVTETDISKLDSELKKEEKEREGDNNKHIVGTTLKASLEHLEGKGKKDVASNKEHTSKESMNVVSKVSEEDKNKALDVNLLNENSTTSREENTKQNDSEKNGKGQKTNEELKRIDNQNIDVSVLHSEIENLQKRTLQQNELPNLKDVPAATTDNVSEVVVDKTKIKSESNEKPLEEDEQKEKIPKLNSQFLVSERPLSEDEKLNKNTSTAITEEPIKIEESNTLNESKVSKSKPLEKRDIKDGEVLPQNVEETDTIQQQKHIKENEKSDKESIETSNPPSFSTSTLYLEDIHKQAGEKSEKEDVKQNNLHENTDYDEFDDKLKQDVHHSTSFDITALRAEIEDAQNESKKGTKADDEMNIDVKEKQKSENSNEKTKQDDDCYANFDTSTLGAELEETKKQNDNNPNEEKAEDILNDINNSSDVQLGKKNTANELSETVTESEDELLKEKHFKDTVLIEDSLSKTESLKLESEPKKDEKRAEQDKSGKITEESLKEVQEPLKIEILNSNGKEPSEEPPDEEITKLNATKNQLNKDIVKYNKEEVLINDQEDNASKEQPKLHTAILKPSETSNRHSEQKPDENKVDHENTSKAINKEQSIEIDKVNNINKETLNESFSNGLEKEVVPEKPTSMSLHDDNINLKGEKSKISVDTPVKDEDGATILQVTDKSIEKDNSETNLDKVCSEHTDHASEILNENISGITRAVEDESDELKKDLKTRHVNAPVVRNFPSEATAGIKQANEDERSKDISEKLVGDQIEKSKEKMDKPSTSENTKEDGKFAGISVSDWLHDTNNKITEADLQKSLQQDQKTSDDNGRGLTDKQNQDFKDKLNCENNDFQPKSTDNIITSEEAHTSKHNSVVDSGKQTEIINLTKEDKKSKTEDKGNGKEEKSETDIHKAIPASAAEQRLVTLTTDARVEPGNSLTSESSQSDDENASTRPTTPDTTPNVFPNENTQISSDHVYKQVELADLENGIPKDAVSSNNEGYKGEDTYENLEKPKIENKVQNNVDAVINESGLQINETNKVHSKAITANKHDKMKPEEHERPVSINSTASTDSVGTVIFNDTLKRDKSELSIPYLDDEKENDIQVLDEDNLTNKDVAGEIVSISDPKTDNKLENTQDKPHRDAKASVLNNNENQEKVERLSSSAEVVKSLQLEAHKEDKVMADSSAKKVNQDHQTSDQANAVGLEQQKPVQDKHLNKINLDNAFNLLQDQDKDLNDQHAAATKIQSNYRGYRARRSLNVPRKSQVGVTSIANNSVDSDDYVKNTLLQHMGDEEEDEVFSEKHPAAAKNIASIVDTERQLTKNEHQPGLPDWDIKDEVTNLKGKSDEVKMSTVHLPKSEDIDKRNVESEPDTKTTGAPINPSDNIDKTVSKKDSQPEHSLNEATNNTIDKCELKSVDPFKATAPPLELLEKEHTTLHTSSESKQSEATTSPRFHSDQDGPVTQALGIVLDQQLALTAPSAIEKQETVKAENPDYIYIPLKDYEEEKIAGTEVQQVGKAQENATVPSLTKSATRPVDTNLKTKELNKNEDKQESKIKTNLFSDPAVDEFDSSKYDLVESGSSPSPRIYAEGDGTVTKVLGTVLGQQLAITTPKATVKNERKSSRSEETEYIYIPLKDPNQPSTSTSADDNFTNISEGGKNKRGMSPSKNERENKDVTSFKANSDTIPHVETQEPVAELITKTKVTKGSSNNEKGGNPEALSLNVGHLVINDHSDKEKEELKSNLKFQLIPPSPTVSPLELSNNSTERGTTSVSPYQQGTSSSLQTSSRRSTSTDIQADSSELHYSSSETPSVGFHLHLSPSPTQNLEEAKNISPISEEKRSTPTQEDRSVQSDSPPLVIHTTQISDNGAFPLAVQLNQPPGAEVLTSPTFNDAKASISTDEENAHAPGKAASSKDSASKHTTHFQTSMETTQRNNATVVEKNMEDLAATKIQASFRGYQVRKHLKLKNGGVESVRRSLRRKSSGKLRGSDKVSHKSSGKPSDVEEKSATKIQAGVRGFLVRRRQKKVKNNTTPESS